MHTEDTGKPKPMALSLLASHRPRNVGWLQAAGLLFGDWGTSRLYVLGLAFLFAGRTSFWLIVLMSLLILAVGWAYTQICRIYPDGGGVYTAAKHVSRTLAVIGALLLFADYTVTASLSVLDAFHYFGLPLTHHLVQAAPQDVKDAGQAIQVQSSFTTAELDELPAGVEQNQTFQRLLQYDIASHRLTFRGKEYFFLERPMTTAERDELMGLSTDSNYRHAVKTIYDQGLPQPGERLLAWDSPGLWAIVAIAAIGFFNFMGPKHTGRFALFAAIGMVAITLLITVSAVFSGKIEWAQIPHRIGSLNHSPADLWVAFVSIVLALSGVEAIANLTGVMKRPVARTARKAIWVVTAEVAVFNIILAIFMIAIFPLDRSQHVSDMMAYLTSFYVGAWGEWLVRIIGGLLLISAGNTAITDMISIQYLMARDGELPQVLQKLNRFGVPWIPAVIAAGVPILVLLISHDLESLAALYAIGVIGAVSINVTLCSTHPRLRRMRRKLPMMLLGVFLLALWVTLAFTKLHALLFVTIVMIVGLTARAATKWWQNRNGPRRSLLQQAVLEQLPADVPSMPKCLIGTYGSESLASAALVFAKREHLALVVCFIREVHLSIKWEEGVNIENDLAAQKVFARFLELGHEAGVPVLPVYDQGPDAATLMAETAATYGVEKILIGSSRRGAIHHLIKGHFQRRVETLLPPEITVSIITAEAPTEAEAVAV
ncbi:MAG TPA: amino acid permease [Tepidisphaeraceae bacterium]